MRFRDLTIIPLPNGDELVMAGDVAAGIGELPGDMLVTTPEIVGAATARVVIMELLAYGAEPTALMHLVGNPWQTIGQRSLAGVKDELTKAGCPTVEINGSSENTMTTKGTSVGVSAVGIKPASKKTQNIVHIGDVLYRVGKPLVGAEVLEEADKAVTYSQLRTIRGLSVTTDMLPVGSHGIYREAHSMAKLAGLEVELVGTADEEALWHKPAGPATTLLVAVNSSERVELEQAVPDAVLIGKFK